jgi:hypothetical protein
MSGSYLPQANAPSGSLLPQMIPSASLLPQVIQVQGPNQRALTNPLPEEPLIEPIINPNVQVYSPNPMLDAPPGTFPVGGGPGKSRLGLSGAEGEDSLVGGAKLQEYGGPGGGHHVPAKSAFLGAERYDPLKAPAISNNELARLSVDHSLVTGAQQMGYRALAQSRYPLTWGAVQEVETNALVRGGMDLPAARATVQNAIGQLKELGVSAPTRIPWSK